jgi:gas vesicle protein
MEKTKLAFNPDTMTVKDVKNAAQTLRDLLKLYDGQMKYVQDAKDEREQTQAWEDLSERIVSRVMNFRDAFDISD